MVPCDGEGEDTDGIGEEACMALAIVKRSLIAEEPDAVAVDPEDPEPRAAEPTEPGATESACVRDTPALPAVENGSPPAGFAKDGAKLATWLSDF
jgi:hypothetical protein